MGITANYTTINKDELLLIMAGGAVQLVDDIYDDRYSFGPRFQPRDDSFQKEVAANPLVLLDYEKLKTNVEQMFANLREAQELSRKRLDSLDNEERIDEICKLYSRDERRRMPCDVPREFGGFTEDELVQECIKRGYRFWLDLDKRWDTMHELLTGVTLREQRDERVLEAAGFFLEQAEKSADLPDGVIRNLREARVSLMSATKLVNYSISHLETMVNETYQKSDDCPEEILDAYSTAQEIRSELAMALPALHRSLMNIAAIEKENDRSIFKANQNQLVTAGECAQSIQTISAEISGKARSNELTESDRELSRLIFQKAMDIRQCLTTSLRERPWLLYFGQYEVAAPATDKDFLSLAVAGGKDAPGMPMNSHQPSFLTIEEVGAIADILRPLECKELAHRHNVPDLEEWDEFYQFKKFYVRASQLNSGVLVFYG